MEDLILEHLQAIRGELAHLGNCISLLEIRQHGVEDRLVAVEFRLGRVEAQLNTIGATQ